MNVPFLDIGAMHDEVADSLAEAWRLVSSSHQYIGGPFVDEFEESWARYCEAEHAVGVANGTEALALTLEAMGVGSGDEVVVPTNTFIATAAAVRRTGATPVFVDVDDSTLLITAEGVLQAITPHTAAVIVVHLFGQPADLSAIREVTRRYGIALIEDAAQAHGARWSGRRVGGQGEAGCFSFYPGKNLGALGDGGAVVTNDAALAGKVRSLANHGRAVSKYEHDLAGTNSRLDGLQAALLTAKLPRLDDWNEARRNVIEAYRTGLASTPARLVTIDSRAEPVHHLAIVRVAQRDQVQQELDMAGIATGIHYPIPCHRQPAFAESATLRLPVAEAAADQILSLPLFPHLSAEQQTFVVEQVTRVLSDELEGSRLG